MEPDWNAVARASLDKWDAVAACSSSLHDAYALGKRAPPLTWKENALYVGGIYAGEVEQRWLGSTEKERPWRVWIMGTRQGRSIGFYSTAEEARPALYAAVCKELGYE